MCPECAISLTELCAAAQPRWTTRHLRWRCRQSWTRTQGVASAVPATLTEAAAACCAGAMPTRNRHAPACAL